MFHLLPCWKDSQIYQRDINGFFFGRFKHQRIEQVALLPQGNRHECHVSKNDLPSQANTQDTCFALWEFQLWDWFDAAREICYLKGSFFPLIPENPRSAVPHYLHGWDFPTGIWNALLVIWEKSWPMKSCGAWSMSLGELKWSCFSPRIGVWTVGNSGVEWYRVI